MANQDQPQIQSTKKSFQLLEKIQEKQGATFTELSDELDMNKSTVYAHLRTLNELNYIQSIDNQYYPGPERVSENKPAHLIEIIKTFHKSQVNSINDLVEQTGFEKSQIRDQLQLLCEYEFIEQKQNKFYVNEGLFDFSSQRILFEIMESLKSTGGAEPKDLADILGKDEQSIRSNLRFLSEEGYVTSNGQYYTLSLKFLDLGGFVRKETELFKSSEPKLTELANETGELANLMTEENGKGVYLYQAHGEDASNLDTYVGFRCPLHATALGKAILAALPSDRATKIINKQGLSPETKNTITDKNELLNELEETNERGYAIDNEERLEGLRCIAAPVKKEDGSVLGAISVAAPSSRMQGERFTEEIPRRVQNTVNLIELEINYT